MKYKQSERQSQRIERITTSHLVLGIDMAKDYHYHIQVEKERWEIVSASLNI